MKYTQEASILAYLKTGKTISPLEALDMFGCFRLAGVVFNLRAQGHDILTQEGRSYRDGRNKRFAVYRLRNVHPAATTTHEKQRDFFAGGGV